MGRGLGNIFLDNLRMAAALIHVIDAAGTTDQGGKPCDPGAHDPLKDIDFLEVEIAMWMRGIITRGWKEFARKTKYGEANVVKDVAERLSGLSVNEKHVEQALDASGIGRASPSVWSDDDLLRFAYELRRVSKPIMIAANKADIPAAAANIGRLKERGYIVVPTCSEAELVLRRAAEKGIIRYKLGDSDFEIVDETKLDERQKRGLELIRKILKQWGSTGVQQVIDKAIYELLKLIVVYPVEDENKFTDKKGNVLPDAFLVPQGTTARGLAYLIHTELGDSFLYAIDARTKMRKGEDYVLKDRDVIRIVATKGR